MICKQCGAEMAASASKCKRCGTKVPAKSDCGGFYDLASAGTRMWEDSKPAAPAPATIYREAPPPEPPYRSKPFMILAIVALVLALLLVISLVAKCSNEPDACLPTESTTAPTEDTVDPDDNIVPSFDITSTTISNTVEYRGKKENGERITITYKGSSDLVDPANLQLDYNCQWRFATAADFPEGEVPENLEDLVVLEFSMDVSESAFGTLAVMTNEKGETTDAITYTWRCDANDNAVTDKGTHLLIIDTAHLKDGDLSRPDFDLTVVRVNSNGGSLTLEIEDIPYDAPEREPEPETEPETEENGGDAPAPENGGKPIEGEIKNETSI